MEAVGQRHCTIILAMAAPDCCKTGSEEPSDEYEDECRWPTRMGSDQYCGPAVSLVVA